MTDYEHDDADAIAFTDAARTKASVARILFNAYLAEGFTDAQALALVRTEITAASGRHDE